MRPLVANLGRFRRRPQAARRNHQQRVAVKWKKRTETHRGRIGRRSPWLAAILPPVRVATSPSTPPRKPRRCDRSSPRDRARPNPGRSATDPRDEIEPRSSNWKKPETCLLGEFFREIGRRDQRLQARQIGARQQLLFGRAGRIETAPAPD